MESKRGGDQHPGGHQGGPLPLLNTPATHDSHPHLCGGGRPLTGLGWTLLVVTGPAAPLPHGHTIPWGTGGMVGAGVCPWSWLLLLHAGTSHKHHATFTAPITPTAHG